MKEKIYLGDSVYVQPWESTGGIILTTEDGVSESNRIFLEPAVLAVLEKYISPPAFLNSDTHGETSYNSKENV